MKLLKCVFILALHIQAYDLKPHESESFPDIDQNSIRLPTNTKPINYDIELNVNIHNGSTPYSGKVVIKIAVDEATNVVTLHNRGLTVEQVTVLNSETKMLAGTISNDLTKDFLILKLNESLVVGEEYTLQILFNGIIASSQNGFYRTSYVNVDNNELRHLAATKFEPAYLRSAIICYDEPALKATFNLKITHDGSLHAISNTEGFRTRNSDSTITTVFEQSPTMSPYLLAFLISDFDYSSFKVGRTLHRIFTRPDNDATFRTQFALTNSDKFLKELERYVSFRYELTKLDQAALPDFQSGGMENWGLITYKEQYLIVDENSHHRELVESVRVTSHEIAHQFFGNAVTCEWWSYLWIQEGMATVFEYLTPEVVLPSYQMKHLFNLQLQNGLRVDADEAVRSMTSAVDKNEELPGIFDRIAYDKSGSVLRMFQHVIGEDIFRDGLTRFMNENNNKSVRPEHLYKAFQESMNAKGFIDFKFANAFETWELQKGFPVIHVHLNKEQKQFKITQKRYLNDESNNIDSSSWFIPLNFAHAGNPDFDDTSITHNFENGTLEKIISTESIQDFNENEWFLFNKQQLNFYRVNYDFENWHNIIRVLNSADYRRIHVLNRAQLVDDALSFAFDGLIDFDVALGVLMYLNRETDYLPWASAANHLDRLDYMLHGDDLKSQFYEFVNHLISRMYSTRSIQQKSTDDIMTKYSRELAINWSCKSGGLRCLQDTSAEIESAMREEKPIQKPLEIAFLCNAIKGDNRKEVLVYYWKKMHESTDQADRLRYIDGLACATDPEIIESLLDSSTAYNSDADYRVHERIRVFNSVLSSSSIGVSSTLEFVSKNYEEISFTYLQSADALLSSIAKRVVTPEHETKMLQVLSKLSQVLQSTTRDAVVTTINKNKQWRASSKVNEIKNFISKYLIDLKAKENNLRLPSTSAPISYELHLKTNVHTGDIAVDGEVTIKLKILESTNVLVLHSRSLNIEKLKIYQADGVTEVDIINYSLYSPTDMLTIYLVDDVSVGTELVLNIKYNCNMNDKPPPPGLYQSGFYKTSYVASDGTTRYVGGTHLVHTYARTIMPCYDEPLFTAVFRIRITHHNSYHTVSNTEGVSINNGDDTVTTIFEETPLMSTYLIGFVVSDYEFITNELTKLPDTTIHRYSARAIPGATTSHALKFTEDLLKNLEDYLDFKYELPKLDSVVISNKDTPIVVWGLITYIEEIVMFQEDFDSSPHKQRYEGVVTIAHELIHQFFGNAVLIDFWSHLWLIEGFTSLMEYSLAATIFPEWRDKDFFNINRLQFVMTEDQSNSAPSMTEVVETINEIESNFGSIAYDKAGSVLRMFQNALSPELFQAALRHYVKTNHHKVVTPSDFTSAFEAVLAQRNFNQFNFTEAFRSWELQKGYPVIHVRYNASQASYHVTQKRYFVDAKMKDDANSSWTIPLNYVTWRTRSFEDTSISHYFVKGTDEKIIEAQNPLGWFIFNTQQMGYYRVNYDFENWHHLINVLNGESFKDIHILNRAQLVDDSMSFAKAGLIDYNVASGVLMYLRRETDYIPWAAASPHLHQISNLFGGRNEEFNNFVRKLSEKLYSAYPFISNAIPSEPIVDRYTREVAIEWACMSGNEICRNDTYVQVHLVSHHERSVPKGIEELIFCNGMKGVNKQGEWIDMWSKMQASRDVDERGLIIRALGCSGDSEVLRDYLQTSIATNTDNNYTRSERLNVFKAVLSSSVGIKAVVEFFEKHEKDGIAQMYSTTIANLMALIATNVYDQSDLTLFVRYLAGNSNLSAELIGTLTRQANENLLKQNDAGVQRLLEAMNKITAEWETEKTTIAPTTLPQTTPSETPTDSTIPVTDPTTSTTLGASTLSFHSALFITVLIFINIFN